MTQLNYVGQEHIIYHIVVPLRTMSKAGIEQLLIFSYDKYTEII
jgi:hypothetical protein